MMKRVEEMMYKIVFPRLVTLTLILISSMSWGAEASILELQLLLLNLTQEIRPK